MFGLKWDNVKEALKALAMVVFVALALFAFVCFVIIIPNSGPNVVMNPTLNDGRYTGQVVSIDKNQGPLILFNVEGKGPVDIACKHPQKYDIGNFFDLARPGMTVDFTVKNKNIVFYRWKFNSP